MRKFVLFTFTVLSLHICAQNKPNILLIVADDASFNHFGAYGAKWLKTPAFDKIAKQGLLFNNAYTPNAKCAPSRSCIITGLNSWQLEEAANHYPAFPKKFKSIFEALPKKGYLSGYTGKGWSPGKSGEIDGKERLLTGVEYNEHTLKAPTKGISNINYAENFNAFLADRKKDQPFFFWFGAKEPHRSYEFETGIKLGGKKTSEIDEVPAFWPDNYEVRADMLDYAFEIEHYDKHLMKMLDKLEEIGELENTLIVATSDNGMPFPRVKGQVYEYSNHLPLAIMWEKGIKNSGRKVDEYVNFIDFVPTFLDVAGLSFKKSGMTKSQGKSMMDIFKDKTSKRGRDFVLVGKERHDVGRPDDQGYPVRGIFYKGYLYLHNYETDRWPACNPETGYRNTDSSPTKTSILDLRRNNIDDTYWQLSFGKRSEEELYDINKDVYCVNNLLKNPSDELVKIKEKLRKKMESELKKQKDPRMCGKGEIFDKYPYANPKVQNLYNRQMKGDKVNKKFKADFDPKIE